MCYGSWCRWKLESALNVLAGRYFEVEQVEPGRWETLFAASISIRHDDQKKKSRAGREIWLWLSSQSVLFFFFLSKLSYVSSWWWQAAAKTEKTGSKSHDASRIKIITMVILLIRHWFRHRQWWESHCYACCYSWNLKKKLIKNKTHRLLDWLPSQRLLSTVARPCGRFSIVPSTRNWCFYFRSVTPKQMPPYPIWNAKPSMTSWS